MSEARHVGESYSEDALGYAAANILCCCLVCDYVRVWLEVELFVFNFYLDRIRMEIRFRATRNLCAIYRVRYVPFVGLWNILDSA